MDLCANACGSCPEAVVNEIANERSLLSPIESGLEDTSDVLLQMNLIEFIPSLCKSQGGLSYVVKSKVIVPSLVALVLDPMIGSAAARVVGEVSIEAAAKGSSIWNMDLRKKFFSAILNVLSSGDEIGIVAAMDAIGSVASSSCSDLYAVLDDVALCKEWLEYASHAKMEIKAACLCSVSKVLSRPTLLARDVSSVLVEDKVWDLNRELFDAVGKCSPYENTMTMIMQGLKQPFEDIRVASFTFLRAVAAQGDVWGVTALFEYAGFMEFITDRSTEGVKVTKEWKFAVVEALVTSKHIKTVLSKPPYRLFFPVMSLDVGSIERSKLTKYFSDGPYVVDGKQELDLQAV